MRHVGTLLVTAASSGIASVTARPARKLTGLTVCTASLLAG
ncbi:hypothetical protein ACIBQ5_36570 [Streptomyces massasporeus]